MASLKIRFHPSQGFLLLLFVIVPVVVVCSEMFLNKLCKVCSLYYVFECLSISCGGTGQQWPAAGAGTLGAADLGLTQPVA